MTGSNDFSEDSADQSGQTDNIQQSSLPKVPLVKLQNVRKDPLIELRAREWQQNDAVQVVAYLIPLGITVYYRADP